jgi:hypothetical protein
MFPRRLTVHTPSSQLTVWIFKTDSFYRSLTFAGGLNNQTLEEAGAEAGLDTQFAFGLSYPTPGTFWSTGGRPPFVPDATISTNDNGQKLICFLLLYCPNFLFRAVC